MLIDGVDVRQLRQQDLRAAIGYVPQKGLLFSGTIASNLRTGDENADDETLRAAAAVAQATEFVDKLPGGMDAPVSQGGTNVSGGQRQRLSIARALVKKAPIYIFDDTFSALDFKTDAALRTALRPWTQDATVLIVAQRVSTIMHAQQIIVLTRAAWWARAPMSSCSRPAPNTGRSPRASFKGGIGIMAANTNHRPMGPRPGGTAPAA